MGIKNLLSIFNKKENNDVASQNLKDRNIVEKNYKMIDALIVLAEDDDKFIETLKMLQEEIRYLTWSPKDVVQEYDQKISDAIEELKEELSDSCGAKAQTLLRNLRVLVAERKAMI